MKAMEALKKIAAKHGKEMAIEVVNEVLFAYIEEVVAASVNKIDDMVLASLEADAKKKLLEYVNGL